MAVYEIVVRVETTDSGGVERMAEDVRRMGYSLPFVPWSDWREHPFAVSVRPAPTEEPQPGLRWMAVEDGSGRIGRGYNWHLVEHGGTDGLCRRGWRPVAGVPLGMAGYRPEPCEECVTAAKGRGLPIPPKPGEVAT